MLGEEYRILRRAWIEIRAENTKRLTEFEQWLGRKVASGTVQQHCQDVEPYNNTFSLCKEAATASPGASRIATFLGYWFIRRGQAKPAAIKYDAASLKKFCSFMQETGKIDAPALKDIKHTLKEAMDE